MRDATWRVGRKVKRTVYIGDQLVGLMDTPELADEVVRAVNNRRMVESAGRDIRADRDRLRSELARERDTNAEIERLRAALRAMARRVWKQRAGKLAAHRRAVDLLVERGNILNAIHEAAGTRHLVPAQGLETAVAAVLHVRSEAARLRVELLADREKSALLGVENDRLRVENADLRRLCADEHSREGQAMDSHVKAGPDGTVSVSTDNGRTWSVPESVKVEDGTFTAPWPSTRAKCERCGQAIYRYGGNWMHAGRAGATACPRACPPAESQPVQVREDEDPAPRVWWDPIRGLLLCDRDVDHRLVDQPPAYNGCCALVPAEVDNPVRIADRLRGLKAVQVLKQLVDAIEDDHAGDMSPLWAEAKRVLGETK